MSRQFINVSWNNAAQNYDGRQQQNAHFLANGSANIFSYSDDALASNKKTKKVPIACRILPQNTTLNRIDRQEKELLDSLKRGEVGEEEYIELQGVLDRKRERAHKSLCKALGKPVEDDLTEGVYPYTPQGENVSKRLLEGILGWCRQYVDTDFILWLTGSVVGCIFLLWLSN